MVSCSVRVSALKPFAVTVTFYVPTGTRVSWHSPLESVVAERDQPVSTFATVTVALGKTAPVLSETRP